ncbi:MAG: GtrA family protein [Prevotellaceae bacterium]|jgi:putative flippase GtrA|nr:GtrA family protein [Prevotellaceae bacterium]
MSLHCRFNSLLGQKIGALIDFFFPPFRKVISQQTFRYGVSGACNMGFDWVLYFVLYNFIFAKQNVDFLFLTFTPHIASLIFSFPITFLSGFWLGRYVSFSGSAMRKRKQLFRYLLVVCVCLLIHYFCLKLFVEVFMWYPTPSKMVITIATAIVSYFSQKYFSFRL